MNEYIQDVTYPGSGAPSPLFRLTATLPRCIAPAGTSLRKAAPMRRIPLVSVISLAASPAACPPAGMHAPPAAAPAPGAQVPTQLPRNVRPIHYSISIAPDAPN